MKKFKEVENGLYDMLKATIPRSEKSETGHHYDYQPTKTNLIIQWKPWTEKYKRNIYFLQSVIKRLS